MNRMFLLVTFILFFTFFSTFENLPYTNDLELNSIDDISFLTESIEESNPHKNGEIIREWWEEGKHYVTVRISPNKIITYDPVNVSASSGLKEVNSPTIGAFDTAITLSNILTNEGTYEEAEADSNKQCGLQTIHNWAVGDCASITQVKICTNWWFTGTVATCIGTKVSNTGTGGTFSADVSSGTCRTSDQPVDCYDVTNVPFPWYCSNFTNDNAAVRLELTSGTKNAYCRFDFIYFDVTYSTADTTPPIWSQPNVNITNPHRGEAVNISVVWEEPDSALASSTLETNETRVWKNYTDGTYGSPRTISGNGPLTVNFTWVNNTGTPRVIGWRMYAENSQGYKNGTNNPSGVYEGNFTMWGWSNVSWSLPDDGSANVGDVVKLVCFVNDTNTTGPGPIQNYLVSFYNETASTSSLLGTNSTNSTGHAVWYWDTTGLSAGTYYPKCNITDNSTMYYNASEYNQVNTTISVENFVEILLSQTLLEGIIFGEITPNTIGNPARNNTSGQNGDTTYNVTVGTSSTQNLDFYVKLNESFESGIYINESSSTTSANSGFSTNTTVDTSWAILGNLTSNCTNIAVNGNCWMRLYFDVDFDVPSGYKNRNYTICGIVTSSNPSICG